jgi:sulfur carrier protein
MTIPVWINGDPRHVLAGQTLPELIADLGLPPQAALVELNGRALLRPEWDGVRLAPGDRLEILRVVAGG